jgi:hypothetical protein
MNIWFCQRPQRGRPPARQHPRARRHRAAPHTLQLQGLQAGHQGHLHRTFLSKALQKFFVIGIVTAKFFYVSETFDFWFFYQRDYVYKAIVYNNHIKFCKKKS